MKVAERSPKKGRKHCGGEIACNEEFLLFPVFSKDFYCKHIKTKANVWKRVNDPEI